MIDIEKLRNAWCTETAAGIGGAHRDPKGQCAVTALLVQDLFGGELVRAVMPDGSSHYWNRLYRVGDIDLTRAQYPDDVEIPRGVCVPIARLLEGERAIAARTAERYVLLKERYLKGV